MSMLPTIDITDLAEKIRQTTVDFEVGLAMGYLIAPPPAGLGFTFLVAFPPAKAVVEFVVRQLCEFLSKGAYRMAFNFNTAVRKASEAHDYVAAVNRKESLPEGCSDEEYAAAEAEEIAEFHRLAMPGE